MRLYVFHSDLSKEDHSHSSHYFSHGFGWLSEHYVGSSDKGFIICSFLFAVMSINPHLSDFWFSAFSLDSHIIPRAFQYSTHESYILVSSRMVQNFHLTEFRGRCLVLHEIQ